jgi:hypothetical protein
MTHPLNCDRAEWAEAAILKFMDETGVDGDREAVSDLIADLGHYCDRHQLEFLPLVQRGIGHWQIEQRDPDSASLPQVSIAIDGEVQS